jgi:hypothetical protein
MKKMFPVLFLICAGIIIAGCTSDPLPPPELLADPDIEFVDGVYEHKFDTPLMEFGKNYEVLIDIQELDWSVLGGCHFQGQLLYTSGSTKYLLASSENAQPQNIAVNGKKYRIVFKAGEISSEDKAEDKQTEGGYSIPGASVNKVPDGAEMIVRITAKTPQWYEFGKRNQPNNGNAADNWDIDYYDEGIVAGIKGEIKVREKPNLTYTDGATVSVNGGGAEKDDTIGKGNIEGTEYEKLKNAPLDSVLRVSCTATVGSSAQPGWGIAEFGTVMDKEKGQNQTVGVGIPRIWNGTNVTNGPLTFWVDILIDDILDASDPNYTFLNVYNGGKVTGMQIRVPTP